MATTTRKDPLPVFCFKVDLALGGGEPATAFFKSVSGIRYETEIVPVREAAVNDTTWQLVGATKWSNIVLKQGFTASSELLKVAAGVAAGHLPGGFPRGVITQLDTAMKVAATWRFYNGWPAKWEIAELDASKSELAIETLEIAHDGIKFG